MVEDDDDDVDDGKRLMNGDERGCLMIEGRRNPNWETGLYEKQHGDVGVEMCTVVEGKHRVLGPNRGKEPR